MKFVLKAMLVLIAVIPLAYSTAAQAAEGEREQPEMWGEKKAEEEERSDLSINSELKAKLLADSQLSGFSVDVDTQQHKVVMTGEVANKIMKDKAQRLAKTVQGVRSIDNQLVITGEKMPPESERSDTGIHTELKAKLFADSELSGWSINVDVEERVVTMTGTVDRQELKTKATELGETVAGVERFNNDLDIEAEKASVQGSDEMGDAMIAAKIRARIASDSRLEGAEIDVEVEDGVATLTGTVANEDQKEAAETIARDTDGVREVKNNLMVENE